MRKKDKLRDILKRNWEVNIDRGHKAALKHKMEELESIEDSEERLEYSGGQLVSKEERIRTQTVVRTDWRPVWAAALILLAVVLIVVPRENISGEQPDDLFQTGTSQDLLIMGFAPTGSRILKHEEARNIIVNHSRIEKRYIYMISDVTFESKQELTADKIKSVFRDLCGKEIDPSRISTLEVMVPDDYYLETRDGSIIYYGVTKVE